MFFFGVVKLALSLNVGSNRFPQGFFLHNVLRVFLWVAMRVSRISRRCLFVNRALQHMCFIGAVLVLLPFEISRFKLSVCIVECARDEVKG